VCEALKIAKIAHGEISLEFSAAIILGAHIEDAIEAAWLEFVKEHKGENMEELAAAFKEAEQDFLVQTDDTFLDQDAEDPPPDPGPVERGSPTQTPDWAKDWKESEQ
jgi:hypothetical protein